MDPQWIAAYQAGIFTEFQEQRAPGHTVCGNKIYHKGMLDIKADIDESLNNLDFYNDPYAYDKREELKAMKIAADSIIMYAQRHAASLLQIAQDEKNPARRQELKQLAAICQRVPAHHEEAVALPPRWTTSVCVHRI